MATCTATHDGHKRAAPKRRPRRRAPPVPPPPEGELCCICAEDMPEGYTKLECGHYYHTQCISEWFGSVNGRGCCLCRKIDVHTVIPMMIRDAFVDPDVPSFLLRLYQQGVGIEMLGQVCKMSRGELRRWVEQQ